MENTDKNEILDAINGLKNEFNGLNSKFDSLENRFDSLENRFDGLESRFDSLENKFDNLENRFDGFENKFDDLENRFDGFENKFDDLENNFSNFKEDLDSVKKSCLRMEVEHGEILAILKDAAAANLEKHQQYDNFSENTEKKLFNHDIRLSIIEDSNFYKKEYKNKGLRKAPLL